MNNKQEYILCAAVLKKEKYVTLLEDRMTFKNPSKQEEYGSWLW